jgi:ribonucleotide monophosphatase NagD (HAD superfamily)
LEIEGGLSLTIFCDIDGTILKWFSGELLPGVKEKFDKWNEEGCQIILTTARGEAWRKYTESQLERVGIRYERLIMELQDYPRHIINDEKEGCQACVAHIVKRDGGFIELEI